MSALGRSATERVRGHASHLAALREARERDAREERLRVEVQRLEMVVRSLRAAIEEEQRAQTPTAAYRKGSDEPLDGHTD